MSKKLISLILVIVLFSSGVLGSFGSAEGVSSSSSDPKAAENQIDRQVDDEQIPDDLEQFVGDTETFVYGLISNQLAYIFDVFPGSIELSDGNLVYGLAYTDYSDCYTNDDESLCCFEAGFIPSPGELPVPQEEIDKGLTITNLDYSDDKTSFIWSYASDAFKQHCVVYNQYVQYGIDEQGALFYEASEYVPGVCDEKLGSLYSFDEAKYLLDLDVGNYLRIAGTSLFKQLNFDEIQKETNRILSTQDVNFASVDVVSCAYFAQEAIVSYLLSLQEETFLGYSVPELVEAAKKLDPMECYQITANGIETLKFEDGTEVTETTKWLVGSACVILTAVSVAGSVIFIECPPLSTLSGVVAGAAIDTFMQVVISNQDFDNVDWRKVAISAAAGALSGFVGPYIYAVAGAGSATLTYLAMDSAIDGLIGGVERAAESWLDGEQAIGVIKSFGIGFGVGAVLSASFKGAAELVSKAAGKMSPAVQKLTEKLPEKLTKKASAIKKGVGEVLTDLKKKTDNTIFHSEYITKKIANRQAVRLTSRESRELIDDSINTLSVRTIYDVNGNEIKKDALKRIASNVEDGTPIGFFKYGDEIIQIVKENGTVGISFDPLKYQTVKVPDGLTLNRSRNFTEAAKIYKNQWLKNKSQIPQEISDAIINKGATLEDLSPNSLVSIIQQSNWVLHENIDKVTVSLVPRMMHEDVKHMGGVGLAKFMKEHMGMVYFDQLVSIAATGSVIAVN